MSFIDSAAEVLARTEATLHALIKDALKAKAYSEIATLASMAESVAAISPRRAREGKRAAVPTADVEIATPIAEEAPPSSEPSWMRPKTP